MLLSKYFLNFSMGIDFGRTFLSFSERAFEISYSSTFNKELGLQFCMNLLSLPFCPFNLMIAYLFNVLKCPFSIASDIESKKLSSSSFQNVS